MKWLRFMMVFVPLAFLLEYVPGLKNDILLFACCCLGLIPLAGYLGEATEELSIHTGPRIGGLLNATLGNAAELIITIVALQAGKYELVKASITGSILGNLLLILGASMFFGGLKNGIQRFDRRTTGVSASMMTLAVVGLTIPTLFEVLRQVSASQLNVFSTEANDAALNGLSLGVAGILMLLYVLSLVFAFQQPDLAVNVPVGVDDHEGEAKPHKARWSISVASGVLGASTLAIVFLSEFLVGAVEPTVKMLGMSEFFVGIIIIPLVGNVAEHIVGVQMALKNKMDLSLAISMGSSTQVALFVAPLLVFISLLVGPAEMTLFFSILEVAALTLAVLIATIISADGESNWLEGAQLLAVYVIVALGFFFLSPDTGEAARGMLFGAG